EEIVTRGAGRPGAYEVAAASWISRRPLRNQAIVEILSAEVGRGEAEVIALAEEMGGRIPVLVDDGKGRRLARQRGHRVLGCGGVLALAKDQGSITEVHSLLDELRAAGLHLSERAYRE